MANENKPKTDFKTMIIVAQTAATMAFYGGWSVRQAQMQPPVPVVSSNTTAPATVETAPSGATAVVPGK